MSVLPHIVTVDPTGTVARIVRAAIDLIDQSVIQIDVPGGLDALDEIGRTGCQLLIAALQLSGDMSGIDLALKVKETHPGAAVIVLGDVDDPPELDEAYRASAPFVYLHRPVDAVAVHARPPRRAGRRRHLFGERPARLHPQVAADLDIGPIPALDMKVAERVVDSLLVDVGAMAIVVANRGGEVLLERGAVGYLDREQLDQRAPADRPHDRRDGAVGGGGQPSALQFYDGERYDVFVLSVGFHHFMCLVFDGQIGERQFGAVNRFGRRAAEDLIALLGINAFTVTPSASEEDRARRRRKHAGSGSRRSPA